MRKRSFPVPVAIITVFLAVACPFFRAAAAHGAERLDPAVRFDKLVVEKKARRLTALSDGRVLREYRVALGPNADGPKRLQGDQKTPEGLYRVDGKNPNSRYHKNLGVSYPNERDRETASALGGNPGGDIKIHGLGPKFRHLGKDHWRYDWTLGCIAVTDEEMDELYFHTDVGAAIEILP
ncbi:MAG: L,D-transpeptidase family protein [Deltaproteobacteria bacterium]|nr:L,D-transpeptidase family protein [Deltaproteobacteria bacterium]